MQKQQKMREHMGSPKGVSLLGKGGAREQSEKSNLNQIRLRAVRTLRRRNFPHF